jgi:hypothetical protein
MQFTTTVLALFATTALAAPAAHPIAHPAAHPVAHRVQHAPAARRSPSPSCSILKCAAALGPSGLACVAAAVQEGLDPMTDLPCIAAIINDVVNPPAACAGC